METMNEVAAFTRGAESVRDNAKGLLALGAGRLTPEDVAMLRRPFAPEAVKWLPIGKPTSNGSMAFMPHIDASLVFERLSDVDPCWTETTEPMLLGANPADPFGLQHMAPWRCTMTVKGVTRSNVGQLAPSGFGQNKKPPTADEKHVKMGHSDAIKRAAWAFGVGAYLRAIPMLYLAEIDGGGKKLWWSKTVQNEKKYGGMNPEGTKALRAQYAAIVNHAKFVEHYGAPMLYGDLESVMEQSDEVVAANVDTGSDDGETANDVELAVLMALAKHNGRDTSAEVVRETLSSTTFHKALAQVLTSVKAALLVDAEDAERLRVTAIAAAEGDEAKIAELVDGLDTLAALAEANAGGA